MVEPAATEDNIILRMRFSCVKTKATDTHSECIILTTLHGNNSNANALPCSAIRSPSVLLNTDTVYIYLLDINSTLCILTIFVISDL